MAEETRKTYAETFGEPKSDPKSVGPEPAGPGQTLHEPSLQQKWDLEHKDWNEEHAELIADVKKAQQRLWEHRNPIIEDPQQVADAKFAEQKKSEKKAASKSASKETK